MYYFKKLRIICVIIIVVMINFKKIFKLFKESDECCLVLYILLKN